MPRMVLASNCKKKKSKQNVFITKVGGDMSLSAG